MLLNSLCSKRSKRKEKRHVNGDHTDNHCFDFDLRRWWILLVEAGIGSHKERRNTMKSSTKDKVKGTYHEAKGKVKEMAGEITDNPKLEAKGKAEKIAGKAQEKIGQVKKVFGN